MNVRLFIAVEITEDTRRKLTEFQDRLKSADIDVGWVAPENFHITLKFIGSVDKEKVDAIVRIIKNSVTDIHPFDLSYIGVGVFPTEKNPRVIFVDTIDSERVLTKIHERLDSQLMALGVKHENRPFEAHLTVGRIKTRRNVRKLLETLHAYHGFNFGLEQVNQVALMESILSRSGPLYMRLNSIHLI
ncbi:MAG: RNA 2',3'-cyclic phosphodiesterase [wastewater metagenome]|nr:RNA 2',3'-cyclic phosphodiesterase [Candidatus Loosdrechtia aerotolerans]